MNSLKIEIQNVLAMAAALESEPVKPGKNEVSDRMERRYQIQARFDALLVEACAPGYSGERVTNGPTMWGRAGVSAEHFVKHTRPSGVVASAHWRGH